MAVTTSSGNGYALYNGDKLPDIDTVWSDKTTYPYATLTRYNTVYILYLTDTQSSVRSDGYPWFSAGTSVAQCVCTFDESLAAEGGINTGEWVLLGESVTPQDGNLTDPVVWVSYDILNSDGTTYLAASDPIPLDGYTVIEWDGEMTGLDVGTYISEGADSGYSLYKVADYIPMRNGDVFAVHFVASNGAEIIGADDYYEAEFGAGGRCHSHLIISAPAGTYTPTVGTLTATITLPSDGVYLYSSDDGQARTTLYAYPASGEGGDSYDETEFLSGLVMGLCSKGNPTFTASDVFGKGYLVGAELRRKRVVRKPIAVYLQINPLKHRVPVFPNNLPHPYTIAIYNAPILGYGKYYRLINSDTPVTVDASGNVVVGAAAVQYNYSSGDSWTLKDGNISASGTKIVWADHDVYDVNGALLMAGSEVNSLYGVETVYSLTDDEITLVPQDGASPTRYAYKFEGIPLTAKDYKVIDGTGVLFPIYTEGVGNVRSEQTISGKKYVYDFYFDENGDFWVSTEMSNSETETISGLEIKKYLF